MNRENVSRMRLHVETGMHEGAKIELVDGEYLLGSATDCDVILMDMGIAPRHARLRVADSLVTVTALEGTVRSNGEYLSDAELSAPLRADDVLDLGAVSVALRTAREAMATVAEPEVPVKALLPARMRALAPTLERAEARALARIQGSPLLERIRRAPGSTRLVGQAMMATAGSAIVLGWSVFLFTSMTAGAADAEELSRDQSRVQAWIDEAGIEGLTVSRADNELRLEGVVADTEQRGELRAFLAELDSPASIEVTDANGVASRAETLFSRMGAPAVRVRHAGGGTYELSGFGGSSDDLRRQAARVKSDLPAVRAFVEGDLVTMENLIERLRAALADEDLGGEILLRASDNRTIEAVGVLSERRLGVWEQLVSEFRRSAPSGVSLDAEVRSSREVLGMDVRTVSHGPIPYVLSADGRRFMEGSELPGGYVIREIGEEALLIARHGHEFLYEYGN